MSYNQTEQLWNTSLFSHFTHRYGVVGFTITISVLTSIILITIMGNLLVVTAFLVDQNLRTISNYLIMSMAVTDLIVACCVMPISALNEVSNRWFLGVLLCDYWIFVDVLSCSASILHLVVIALDRYCTITKIQYKNQRTTLHLLITITMIWVISAIIAIPSRFYLGRDSIIIDQEVVVKGQCMINNGYVYTLFSTVGAYYIPMLFIIILYWRIYQTARQRIHKKVFNIKLQYQRSIRYISRIKHSFSFHSRFRSFFRDNKCWAKISEISDTLDLYPSFNEQVSNINYHYNIQDLEMSDFKYADDQSMKSLEPSLDIRTKHCEIHLIRLSSISSISTTCTVNTINELVKGLNEHKRKLELQRERKATMTLGVITSCFILCWTPFFIHALVHPFCNNLCNIDDLFASIFLWLGYLNCLINPFIYTFFSPEFRVVFKNILTGHYISKFNYK